jgi:hypothetical protein
MFRRNGVFYVQDNQSGRQESLHTRSRADAEKLFHAKNEAAQGPMLNRDLGRVYLSASDPDSTRRTWSAVMAELRSHDRASTQLRYDRAMLDTALAGIRDKAIIETNAADLLAALRSGTRCTNHYLRRLHNLALGLGWLNWPLLAPKMWPKIKWRTWDHHHRTRADHFDRVQCRAAAVLRSVLGNGRLPVRRGQSDQRQPATTSTGATGFCGSIAPNSRWTPNRPGSPSGRGSKQLPSQGPLFPYWGKTTAKDRAAEFRRRCRILKLEGVSLHSYRYAWAERAFEHGYPERFAQAALGHSSRAVHQAYAKEAKVICPSLEEYEKKVIPLPVSKAKPASEGLLKGTATNRG